MEQEAVLQARHDIEEALKNLSRQSDTEMMCRIAASKIVAALTPNVRKNTGTEYYRIKAEDWISLLLTEPQLDILTLHIRLVALASVSDHIKAELGALPGRLALLV